jgi:6-phosphogluconolactonase
LPTTTQQETTMPQEQLYVQTNSAEENEIAVFNRSAEGTLLPAGRVRTGGYGTGVGALPVPGGINSQGSLALSADRQFLFAVNAGSNDISSFAIVDDGLRLVARTPSRGPGPVSIAVHGSLMYVANQFGRGEIAGFAVDADGQLSPLEGSERPVSIAGASPAQVSFTRDGRFLVVTELATDRIVTYRVNSDGRTGRARSVASSGQTPFGFAFDPAGRLVVSEAFRDAPQGSAVSSYRFAPNGDPVVISGSVPTHQTSACWVVITSDGRYAYASDSNSASISGYSIDVNGNLSLLSADGRTAATGEGSHPTDMAISGDGRQLYVLSGGTETIGVFAVQTDGSLVLQPSVGGIPTSSVGMVIR